MKRAIALVLPFSFAACQCDVGEVTADSQKDVAGDDNSSTDVAVDEVDVEEANVDVDTDIDAEADVENNADVDIDVDIGGGGDDEEDDAEAEDAAVGDEVGFVHSYQGIVDEHATLTPRIADGLAVSSIEWILRDAVFDEATVIDDDDWFVWGAANDDGSYVLSAGFGDDAVAPFVWGKETRFCDGDCVARSISAVCTGQIVLRVWLDDGTFRDAVGEHESARVTCD